MSKQDHAILFDFWQTLVEDKRERQALVRRQELVEEFLQSRDIAVPKDLGDAFKAGTKRFFEVYHAEQRTATLLERIQWILEYLGLAFAPEEYEYLIDEVARAGLLLNPQPTESIAEVLGQLSRDYRLGIVSDTGFTPGWVLRQHLERHNLLKYFSAISFSDETGFAKPHPKTFQKALEMLAVAPENAP
jgi:putative hydrolase of the HAD superfamily